jgi:ABC-type nitrate/sulfonate/bicarbonate transport system substrate-binding protein
VQGGSDIAVDQARITEGGSAVNAPNEMMAETVGRRNFLLNASALGAASLLGLTEHARAEPPPETTKLTLIENPVTCIVPTYVAEELLYAEGFTDVRYRKFPSETQLWPPEGLVSGEFDIALTFIPTDIIHIDNGSPIVVLAGAISAAWNLSQAIEYERRAISKAGLSG